MSVCSDESCSVLSPDSALMLTQQPSCWHPREVSEACHCHCWCHRYFCLRSSCCRFYSYGWSLSLSGILEQFYHVLSCCCCCCYDSSETPALGFSPVTSGWSLWEDNYCCWKSLCSCWKWSLWLQCCQHLLFLISGRSYYS